MTVAIAITITITVAVGWRLLDFELPLD